jgi:hypothetical protein
MTHSNKLEDLLKRHYDTQRQQVRCSQTLDQEVLSEIRGARPLSQPQCKNRIGSFIMKHRFAGIATATVITVMVLIIVLSPPVNTPAFAIEPTLAALKQVKTVHMRGKFYMQGQFECWMRFDGDPDKPTHLWLGLPGKPLCKICGPDGVFGLNRRTNRVHFARRDERNKPWLIQFGFFWETVLGHVDAKTTVEVTQSQDPNTGQDVTLVDVKRTNRDQMFTVDPNTRLPLRMTTLRDDNPQEMIRRTLWIRDIEWIRYNEEPPPGLFDLPEDAEVVTEEVDTLVDPDNGLIVDGMTDPEAAKAIVTRVADAMVALDREMMQRYALTFRIWPDSIWQQVRVMKDRGQWVEGYTMTGEPYQEGKVWFIACQIQHSGGKVEVDTPMIKFYNFEGHRYAFVIGNKEKGVVD